VSRFPAAFRPPAFASRSSDSRRGVGPSLRSAYRPEGRTATGLPRSARMSCDRVGCPLYPEDGGAHPGLSRLLSRRLPLLGGQSLHPAPTSHPTRYCFTRHQRGFKRFTRPVFPSPVTPGWNGRPWAFPRASHPAGSTPATHVEVGTGHRARAWNYSLNITSADPPIRVVHSQRATSRRTTRRSRRRRRAIGSRVAPASVEKQQRSPPCCFPCKGALGSRVALCARTSRPLGELTTKRIGVSAASPTRCASCDVCSGLPAV
jgi:hypothetical protein